MFLLVISTFALLDHWSVSLGDDYGYMFTDSQNHNGDGHQVESLADCWNTQMSHYRTTNGRFLVHLLTQMFLCVTPSWVWRFCNALVFGLLWLFGCRLVSGKGEFSLLTGTLMWSAIWILMPDPGLIMLSLVAFSTNYMWTGASTLAFLWIYLHGGKFKPWAFAGVLIFSLLAGSMQESYSLPVCGALVLIPIFTRRMPQGQKLWLATAYIIGTLACICAPGNGSHLQTAGGLGLGNILYKAQCALRALIISPLTLWLVCMAYFLGQNWVRARKYLRDNRFLITILILGFLLDCVTYTSSRQLYCVSLVSLVLILRLPVWRMALVRRYSAPLAVCIGILTLAVLAGAWVLRRNTYTLYRESILTARTALKENPEQSAFLTTDIYLHNYNSNPRLWTLLRTYDPDPWETTPFTLPYNTESKHALSRLYTGNTSRSRIGAVLPLSTRRIRSLWAKERPEGAACEPVPIDGRYQIIAVPKGSPLPTLPRRRESFTTADTLYYITPRVNKK